MTLEDIKKNGVRMERPEFDRLCREKKIANPQMETFGDGQGDPYNPVRLIFGYRNGNLVWTKFK
jgi:hypothetical protein